MYIKKGKPCFGYKDTWSMGCTLAPIITSGLIKFREEWLKSGNGMAGTVISDLLDMGVVTSLGENIWEFTSEDWVKMDQVFLHFLDEMIFAFDDNEPDNMEFNLRFLPRDLDFTEEEREANKLEHSRYRKVLKEHQDRCDKGRMLFAEYFNALFN
jgi:hypothetical protein